MNANELRIGNYAIVKDAPIESIIRVRAQHIAEAEEHNPSWFLYPIPLTPEKLEKCGFIYRNDSKDIMDNGYFVLYLGDSIYFNSYPIVQVKYLHQLQNLYFALTGTELTVNL
jgi:hypothetical protein